MRLKSRPPALAIPTPPGAPGPAPAAAAGLTLSASDDELQLSSPGSSSSASSSPRNQQIFFDAVDEDDGLSQELSELRLKVQTNLRLRPIRSSQSLAQLAREQGQVDPSAVSAEEQEFRTHDSSPSSASSASASEPPEPDYDLMSPMSGVTSARSSVYFTPTSETPLSGFARTPQSAHFVGVHGAGAPKVDYAALHAPRTPSPRSSQPISPGALVERVRGLFRPLIVDTRPLPAYTERRVQGAINVAIPTLILKRSRKSGGFPALGVLRQYITTAGGLRTWDALLGEAEGGAGPGAWDGDLIVYDEDMDERGRDGAAPAWALLPLVERLLNGGGADWVAGGFAACVAEPELRPYLLSGADEDEDETIVLPDAGLAPAPLLAAPVSPLPGSQPSSARRAGLRFQIDTLTATERGRKALPEIEPESSISLAPPSGVPWRTDSDAESTPPALPRSPLPLMSHVLPAQRSPDAPSPAPSHTSFNRPRPPMKKPSAPNLLKLDTRSMERLPKLAIKPVPSKSLSLSVPSISTHAPADSSTHLRPPRSPSHLNLAHSNHTSPPPSAGYGSSLSFHNGGSSDHLPPPTPSFGGGGFGGFPPSPRTPRSSLPSQPPSPLTARPTPDTSHPPTSDTEEAYPEFTVSTIIPGFLYLGPEAATDEQVGQLETIGVRRILNLALECDDDQGLRLRERFERYIRIPMRDTVEEDNITQGVQKACAALGSRASCHCSVSLLTAPQTTRACTARRRTCTARRASRAR
jgi:hypothetical protein